MSFSQQRKGRYVLSLVCTHNAMHMFLTFYRNTLESLDVCWFCLFFYLWGFIPPVGLISSPNWVIMGSCAVKITCENQKRKMLRTSNLLIKMSVAEPCISFSCLNHFGSSSQWSASISCWSCDISASFCARGAGANLPQGHGYGTASLLSNILEHPVALLPWTQQARW